VVMTAVAGLLLTVPVLAHDSLNGRLVLGWLAVAAGTALGVWALDRRTRPGRRVALLGGAVCVALAVSGLAVLGTTLASPYAGDLLCRDDVAAATFGGAAELRAGQDPYASYATLAVERAHGCAHLSVTIRRNGRFAGAPGLPSQAAQDAAVAAAVANPGAPEVEQRLDYPAGSVLLGLVGSRAFPWLMALLLAGAVAVTVRRATSDRRVVAVALAAQLALVSLVPDGHTDAAVVALLLLAWGSPAGLLGGLALGLACGTKQTAWFFVPALLGTAFARGGFGSLARVGMGTVAGFALLNLPFVVLGPGAWLHGVLAPATDGLFPLGAGPIGLITSGVLPIGAVPLFWGLQLGLVALSAVLSVRLDGRWPGIGVLVASLALFVGTRSLLEYIAGAGVLLVCVVATAPPAADEVPEPRPVRGRAVVAGA